MRLYLGSSGSMVVISIGFGADFLDSRCRHPIPFKLFIHIVEASSKLQMRENGFTTNVQQQQQVRSRESQIFPWILLVVVVVRL